MKVREREPREIDGPEVPASGVHRRHFLRGLVGLGAGGEMQLTDAIAKQAEADSVMAYEFSGNALPIAHGAPVRALVPDRYFYKSVKWLEGIKFSAVDEPGYYESGGYSNTADPWKEERFD